MAFAMSILRRIAGNGITVAGPLAGAHRSAACRLTFLLRPNRRRGALHFAFYKTLKPRPNGPLEVRTGAGEDRNASKARGRTKSATKFRDFLKAWSVSIKLPPFGPT